MSSELNSWAIAISGIVIGAVIVSVRAVFARLREIELTLSKLDTKVSPMWARVQAQISSDLHHPHPRYAEMDGLLEKLEALEITDLERARLKVLLAERAVDMHADISDSQRSSAKIMGDVMDKVLAEKEATGPVTVEQVAIQGVVKESASIPEKGPENPDKQ